MHVELNMKGLLLKLYWQIALQSLIVLAHLTHLSNQNPETSNICIYVNGGILKISNTRRTLFLEYPEPETKEILLWTSLWLVNDFHNYKPTTGD